MGVIAAVLILGEEAAPLIFVSATLVIVGAYSLAPRGKGTGHWSETVHLALLVAIMWGSVIVPMKYCLNEGVMVGTFLAIGVISAAATCNVAMGIHHIRTGIKFDKRGVGLSVLSGILGFFIGHLLFLHALEIEKASMLAPVCGAVIPFGFLLSINR